VARYAVGLPLLPVLYTIEAHDVSKQQYPEPTVGALIFNSEDKLFLMRSHKWRGMYVIPGGHVELGERMEDALRREIEEETGLAIYDVVFLAFQEFIHDEAFWKRRHFIFFDYVCKTDASDVRLNDEAQEYVWVTVEEALKLPIEPYTRVAIETYLEKVSSSP
jgi:nucleoside triphosphatase